MKKQEILQRTGGGLAIFQFYVRDLIQSGKWFKGGNPMRHDNNPTSFLVWMFKDKAYGKDEAYPGEYKVDCFALIARMNELDVHVDFVRVLEIAEDIIAKIESGEFVAKPMRVQESLGEVERIELEVIEFTDDAWRYWKDYGVTIEMLEQHGVKQIIGYQLFYIDGKHYQRKLDDFGLHFAFTDQETGTVKVYTPIPLKKFKTLLIKSGYSFFTKGNAFDDLILFLGGEKDCVVANSAIDVSAMCFQSENTLPDMAWLKAKFPDKKFRVLYDDDATGHKMAGELAKLGFEVLNIASIVPSDYEGKIKDVSDYVKAGLCLDRLRELVGGAIKPVMEEVVKPEIVREPAQVITQQVGNMNIVITIEVKAA